MLFIDTKTNIKHFESELKTNHWAKSNLQYFCNWKIVITENGKPFFEEVFNAKDKRVYIALDSKALGDTLAWIPYVEEFGKVHKFSDVAFRVEAGEGSTSVRQNDVALSSLWFIIDDC